MQVECLVLRVGITDVFVGEHKFEFQPVQGAFDGEPTTSVANIADPESLDYLVGNDTKGIKGRPNFRPYIPKRAYEDMLKRRKEREAKMNKYRGFSFEKVILMGVDRGYMIVDDRGPFRQFMGMDGTWTRDIQHLSPFGNLKQAEECVMALSPDALPEKKPYPCAECDKSFDNPDDLAKHWRMTHKLKTKTDEPETDKIPAETETHAAEHKTYRTPAEAGA